MGGFGFKKSKEKTSSDPVDVTPEAFKNLQGPFADVLAQLLGFSPQSGTTTSTSFAAPTAAPVQGLTLEQRRLNAQADKEGGSVPFQAPVIAPTATSAPASAFAPSGDPNDVLRGVPSAEGPFAAPVGAGEQTLLDQLLGKADGTSTSSAQDLLMQTIGGNFLTENPFLANQIKIAQRTNLQGLEELLTRTLPGVFTQGGQFVQPEGSSAFDRARSIGLRGVAQTNADIAGQLAFQGFEAERGRQQEAATALPQVTEAEVNTLISNLQAQALPRLIEQFGLEAGTEAFNQQMNALLQVLAITSGTTQAVIGQESKGKASSFGFDVSIGAGGGGDG